MRARAPTHTYTVSQVFSVPAMGRRHRVLRGHTRPQQIPQLARIAPVCFADPSSAPASSTARRVFEAHLACRSVAPIPYCPCSPRPPHICMLLTTLTSHANGRGLQRAYFGMGEGMGRFGGQMWEGRPMSREVGGSRGVEGGPYRVGGGFVGAQFHGKFSFI